MPAGWIPPATDTQALTREIRRIITPMLQKSMAELDFAPMLMGILDVARRYHLEIPPQLVLLVKTLVHVEGLGRDLYPALDIWSLGKPLLGQWLSSRLNPAETVKKLGQQVPTMLLGMPNYPTLFTTVCAVCAKVMHGKKNNGASYRLCTMKQHNIGDKTG